MASVKTLPRDLGKQELQKVCKTLPSFFVLIVDFSLKHCRNYEIGKGQNFNQLAHCQKNTE